jgi:hypothetical protein
VRFSERHRANSDRRPGAASWNRCSGEQASPLAGDNRDHATPPAPRAWLAHRLSAVPDPDTRPTSLAPRCTSIPTKSPSLMSGAPVWMPIRTRGGSPCGHRAAANPRCVRLRTLDRIIDPQEDGEEGIPGRADLATARRGDRVAQHAMMLAEHLAIARPEAVQHVRGPLNVGEQQRHHTPDHRPRIIVHKPAAGNQRCHWRRNIGIRPDIFGGPRTGATSCWA